MRWNFSYFQTRLIYCLSSWGFTSTRNVVKVFKVQKKILRIMMGLSSTTSCRNIFKDLGILTSPSLIVKECCLSVKRKLTLIDFKTKTHDYDTRQKTDFKVKTDMTRLKSPLCFNRSLYNCLPKNVLECARYQDFKRDRKSTRLNSSH